METKQKIRILISDDHQLIRRALRKAIAKQDDMMVVGEATDGIEAVKFTKETSPDVILMDVDMPKMDGITATEKIMSFDKHIRIIGLSLYDQKLISERMLKAGAVAYTTKDDDLNILWNIIRKEAIKSTPYTSRNGI